MVQLVIWIADVYRIVLSASSVYESLYKGPTAVLVQLTILGLRANVELVVLNIGNSNIGMVLSKSQIKNMFETKKKSFSREAGASAEALYGTT